MRSDLCHLFKCFLASKIPNESQSQELNNVLFLVVVVYNYKDHWDQGLFTCYDILRHITHYYLISFVEGLFPHESEAHCGYTSLQEYVITIELTSS